MDEYNPYASLYPDFTGDLFGAGVAALPPIAGASPGPLDAIAGFVTNTIASEFVPLAGFIGDQLSVITREAWAAVQGAYSLIVRAALRTFNATFGIYYGGFKQVIFSQRLASPSFGAGDILGFIFEALINALEAVRDAGLNWAKDRMIDALGFASAGFNSVFDFTWRIAAQYATWVWDQVRAGLGYAAGGFVSVFDFTWHIADQYATWVFTQVKAGLGYAAGGFSSVFDFTWRIAAQYATWVSDQVKAGMGYVAGGFTSVFDMTWRIAAQYATWVFGQVKAGLGYAAYGFASMAAFVRNEVQYATSWINSYMFKPLLDEVKKVGAAVISGGMDIVGFFVDALQKALIGPIDVIVDTANAKLAIPGKLFHGQYPSLDAFLTDLMDPAPVIIAGLVGVLVIPLIIALVSSAMMTTVVQPYLERPTQIIRKAAGDHLMTVNDIQEAWNRGLLPELAAVDLLGRTGYGGQSLEAVKGLRYQMPGESDLVRFGVREVFTPEIAQRFGQFEQFPAGFGEAMAKLGYLASGSGGASGASAPGGRSWAEAYWAAHWQLPSITQAFEMYQRRVTLRDGGTFNDASLDQLLRAQDVMPYWRDTLKQIAYNPLTRVDIRRMYHARVLTEQEVYNAYLDVGYNPVNARRLTDFTKLNYAPADKTTGVVNRELTATAVRTSYRRHIITRDDALTRLIEIGYDSEESDFLLDLDDAQLAQNALTDHAPAIRDLTVATIRQAYRERLYTRPQAITELGILGYTGAEAGVMLSLEDFSVTRDFRNARADEIREKYVSRAVDYAAALAELIALPTPPDHAQWLIATWGAAKRAGERKLAVADVFKALKLKYFTDAQALAYLLRLGYNDADAAILMRLRGGV